jgi:hypothetical protein
MTGGSLPHFVIPAKAGIQKLPATQYLLDTGFLRCHDQGFTILMA